MAVIDARTTHHVMFSDECLVAKRSSDVGRHGAMVDESIHYAHTWSSRHITGRHGGTPVHHLEIIYNRIKYLKSSISMSTSTIPPSNSSKTFSPCKNAVHTCPTVGSVHLYGTSPAPCCWAILGPDMAGYGSTPPIRGLFMNCWWCIRVW